MPRTATVKSHIRASERQVHQIDAGDVAGKVVSPEHAGTEVQLISVRAHAGLRFDKDGAGFLTAPASVRAFGPNHRWRQTYDRELTVPLKREAGATDARRGGDRQYLRQPGQTLGCAFGAGYGRRSGDHRCSAEHGAAHYGD